MQRTSADARVSSGNLMSHVYIRDMNTTTHEDFVRRSGEALIILVSVIIYCTYRWIRFGFNIELLALILTGVICTLGIRRLTILADLYQAGGSVRFPFMLDTVLMVGLGCLAFYLFFYKGAYSLYAQWSLLTWTGIAFRLLILLMSYRLVLATSCIQTVTGAIRKSSK